MTVPLEQHSVNLGGVEIAYAEVQSERPPAVLLHGIGMDWRVWQAVSRRLAPHFRLIMPDLRGHGSSAKPDSGYTLADYALDIENLLEYLRIDNVTLIGSSLGGMVAIAVEEPIDVVSSRIVVDPPMRRGSGPARPLFEAILAVKTSGISRSVQVNEMFSLLEADSPAAGKQYLRYMAHTWSVTASGVLEEALSPVESNDEIESALAAIPSPTLIMRAHPARGSVLRPEDAERALEMLRFGTLKFYVGAGHAIHGSRPEEFASDVITFAQRAQESALSSHAGDQAS